MFLDQDNSSDFTFQPIHLPKNTGFTFRKPYYLDILYIVLNQTGAASQMIAIVRWLAMRFSRPVSRKKGGSDLQPMQVYQRVKRTDFLSPPLAKDFLILKSEKH